LGDASCLFARNAGSSSIKFALHALAADGPARICAGKLEGIGTAPHLSVRDAQGGVLIDRCWEDGAALTHEMLLQDLLGWVRGRLGDHELVAAGHRVVHGGAAFSRPVRIDDDLLPALGALVPLAPLHQPHNLAAIRAMKVVAPGLPQVACFDTAFHHGRPDVATRLALPRAFHDRGIRRYGFLCARLGWAGVAIDADANAANAAAIGTIDSRVAVHVIPTDEERMIAIHKIETLDGALAR